MRWNSEIPKEGDIRKYKEFLYLPKTLPFELCGREVETRWWEEAEIVQKYYRAFGGGGYWSDIRWADE